MSKKLFFAFLIAVILFQFPTIAFADPGPTDEPTNDKGTVIAQKAIEPGGRSKNIPNGVSPLSVIGGPGNEYGVLSSIISWVKQWNHYDVSGKSKIQIYNATKKAYAWTELWQGSSILLKTSAKCLAPAKSSCTSIAATANGFDFRAGTKAINDAFTTIYWSNGSTTNADVIAQKTF